MEDTGRGLAQGVQSNIEVKVEKFQLKPRRRKLKGRWTMEMGEYEIVISEQLADHIQEEIDKEIMASIIGEIEKERELVKDVIPDKMFDI